MLNFFCWFFHEPVYIKKIFGLMQLFFRFSPQFMNTFLNRCVHELINEIINPSLYSPTVDKTGTDLGISH